MATTPRVAMLCAVALVLGAAPRALAQAVVPAHRIEARVAIDSASVRDDTLVPLAFTGPALTLGARYGYELRRHSFDAELHLGFGVLLNRFSHLAAAIEHDIGFGYAYALCADEWHRLALGAGLRMDTNIAYLGTWDDAHDYWLASLGLWPRLDYARPIASFAQLESRAQFMLLGAASRPPAYRLNKQDAQNHPGFYFDRIAHSPRWVSPLSVQAIELEALVRFRDEHVNLGHGWGLGGEARFARARDPEPYLSLYLGVLGSYGFGL